MSKQPVSYRLDPDELAKRKAKRLSDRRKLQVATILSVRKKTAKAAKTAKNDRARHRAIVFLTTLPTDKLLAVYRAALQHFKS